mmetsp:Transcript_26341/g.66443  ORF Transcript_26341/g.66443 Transcript_26341/m.66443 type:complete len:1666 (-) Transcript_26341:1049-6046(-)
MTASPRLPWFSRPHWLLFSSPGFASVAAATTTNTGSRYCPCASPSLSWWTVTTTNNGTTSSQVQAPLGYRTTVTFPDNYGQGECRAWDSTVQPFCADAAGNPLAPRPDWCDKKWCFVSNLECENEKTAVSSLLTVSKSQNYLKQNGGAQPAATHTTYSYSTCGEADSFSGQGNSTSTAGGGPGATALLQSVERSLRSTKRTVETDWVLLAADRSAGASLTSLCAPQVDMTYCRDYSTGSYYGSDCPYVSSTSPWYAAAQKVDEQNTGALLSGVSFHYSRQRSGSVSFWRCVHESFRAHFLQTFKSEYALQTTGRIAYMYAGFAEGGEYIQWPAMNFQGASTYDPRFRPWYAMVASGPKNVIVTIDTSGSMTQDSRLTLAKQAAVKVLETLTWVDYFLVIAFATDVAGCARELIPATEANVAKAKTWINNLEARGTTNYRDALAVTFARAQQATAFDGAADLDQCFSARCNTVALFLSDGTPNSWGTADADNLKLQNVGGGTLKLLTYALGSDADTTVLAQLAADHGGKLFTITQTSQLPNTMAQYYKELAATRGDTNAVRWIRYTDVVSSQTVLAGCVALEDNRENSTDMVGVACMDANMLVPSLSQLEGRSDYANFTQAYEQDSRQCGATSVTNPYAEQISLQCAKDWQVVEVCETRGSDCLNKARPARLTTTTTTTTTAGAYVASTATSASSSSSSASSSSGSGTSSGSTSVLSNVGGGSGTIACKDNCNDMDDGVASIAMLGVLAGLGVFAGLLSLYQKHSENEGASRGNYGWNRAGGKNEKQRAATAGAAASSTTPVSTGAVALSPAQTSASVAARGGVFASFWKPAEGKASKVTKKTGDYGWNRVQSTKVASTTADGPSGVAATSVAAGTHLAPALLVNPDTPKGQTKGAVVIVAQPQLQQPMGAVEPCVVVAQPQQANGDLDPACADAAAEQAPGTEANSDLPAPDAKEMNTSLNTLRYMGFVAAAGAFFCGLFSFIAGVGGQAGLAFAWLHLRLGLPEDVWVKLSLHGYEFVVEDHHESVNSFAELATEHDDPVGEQCYSVSTFVTVASLFSLLLSFCLFSASIAPCAAYLLARGEGANKNGAQRGFVDGIAKLVFGSPQHGAAPTWLTSYGLSCTRKMQAFGIDKSRGIFILASSVVLVLHFSALIAWPAGCYEAVVGEQDEEYLRANQLGAGMYLCACAFLLLLASVGATNIYLGLLERMPALAAEESETGGSGEAAVAAAGGGGEKKNIGRAGEKKGDDQYFSGSLFVAALFAAGRNASNKPAGAGAAAPAVPASSRNDASVKAIDERSEREEGHGHSKGHGPAIDAAAAQQQMREENPQADDRIISATIPQPKEIENLPIEDEDIPRGQNLEARSWLPGKGMPTWDTARACTREQFMLRFGVAAFLAFVNLMPNSARLAPTTHSASTLMQLVAFLLILYVSAVAFYGSPGEGTTEWRIMSAAPSLFRFSGASEPVRGFSGQAVSYQTPRRDAKCIVWMGARLGGSECGGFAWREYAVDVHRAIYDVMPVLVRDRLLSLLVAPALLLYVLGGLGVLLWFSGLPDTTGPEDANLQTALLHVSSLICLRAGVRKGAGFLHYIYDNDYVKLVPANEAPDMVRAADHYVWTEMSATDVEQARWRPGWPQQKKMTAAAGGMVMSKEGTRAAASAMVMSKK